MSPAFDKVLVVIPTYNEKENIQIICSRLLDAVSNADILIADDNSPDGTGEIADRMADAEPRIHVMHRTAKNGLGAAYLAGFRWGLDHGYDALVEMDADGSHQPEQLPALLDALEHADMVKGSRYVPGGSIVNWPKSRELLSRGGSWWTRLMIGIPVADITGGFNAFRAETLRSIMDEISSVGYNFQVDLTWHVISKGMTVAEVPITFIERERGKSKMSSGIVVEALAKTTAWGISYRAGQAFSAVKNLFGGKTGKR